MNVNDTLQDFLPSAHSEVVFVALDEFKYTVAAVEEGIMNK